MLSRIWSLQNTLLTGSHGGSGEDMFAICLLVGYYIYYSQAAMEAVVGICLPCVLWLVIIYITYRQPWSPWWGYVCHVLAGWLLYIIILYLQAAMEAAVRICLPYVLWLVIIYILLTGSHGGSGEDMFSICSLVGYYIYYLQAAMEAVVRICLPCVLWLVIIYITHRQPWRPWWGYVCHMFSGWLLYILLTGSHGGRGGDMFSMCSLVGYYIYISYRQPWSPWWGYVFLVLLVGYYI